jgi:DNA-binding transcriptional MerR regulator
MNTGQAAQASGISANKDQVLRRHRADQQGRAHRCRLRQYSETSVRTLQFIKRSRELGFSLEGVKTLLGLWGDRERKSGDVQKLARQYIAELDDDIAKLQSKRGQLEQLSNCCHGNDRPECPILDDLAKPADRPHK